MAWTSHLQNLSLLEVLEEHGPAGHFASLAAKLVDKSEFEGFSIGEFIAYLTGKCIKSTDSDVTCVTRFSSLPSHVQINTLVFFSLIRHRIPRKLLCELLTDYLSETEMLGESVWRVLFSGKIVQC
eukprot:666969_1